MRVRCPIGDGVSASTKVDLEECLACRYLMATAVDRMPQFMCAVDWAVETDGNDSLVVTSGPSPECRLVGNWVQPAR
jgi:hypothetical protein